MPSRRIDARDEEGDVVFTLKAVQPNDLPGHVRVEVGGFSMLVSAQTSAEIGRCFLNASTIAMTPQKAQAA